MKTASAILALGLFALPSAARAADAPTKKECLEAHEQGQIAHKKGDLEAARARFEICSESACPELVSKDCSERLKKIEAEIPSLNVDVRGPDAENAELSVDGTTAKRRDDGTLELTPGEHVISAKTADGRSAEEHVTVAAGSHGVTITLELPAPAPKPEPTPAPEPESKGGIKPVVLVLGGVAVVGLAGFTAFGLAGKSKQSELDDCKPNCTRGDVDSMRQKYLFADISLGVALVAGGAAAYLHFSDKKKEKEQPGVAWVSGAPLRRGAAVGLGGRF